MKSKPNADSLGFRTILALFALVTWIQPATPQESPPVPLRSAYEVTSLPDTLAGRQLAIELDGTVTAAEPDWNGQFFLQDETGGLWVEYFGHQAPQVGDRISIRGQSHPGAFAPIIAKPQWTVTGKRELPPAIQVPIDNLVLGVYDGKRIEISGTVRNAKATEDRLAATLAIGGHRLEVRAPRNLISDPEQLIGASLRVRGTTATHYNQTLRHLTGVAVYVVQPEDFVILAAEEQNPFDLPVIEMNRVAQYRKGMGSDRRIRIRGQVTHRGLGTTIFVQDETAALRIMSTHTDNLEVGQEVDVAGFLEFENHLPFLNDGVFKNHTQADNKITPSKVPIAEIKAGLHHGELVSLSGKVLDRTTRPILNAAGDHLGESTTWLIQGQSLSFTAEHESFAPIAHLGAPVGSTVEATGVCFSKFGPQNSLRSVQLLLANPSSIIVTEKPSWLTPTRLLIGLAILAPLLIIAVAWSLTVSKKNARLKVLVREKQEAQNLLQLANDTLEQKVEDRSQQLQVEMSARKEARVQFKAVISERTRLARDLHDTLEQALTGVALQLETANKLFDNSTDKAKNHVALARRWLGQSQIELRNSIWDLRSRELEQFDLEQALKQSVERLAESVGLQATFKTTGNKRPLEETLEENVLRIGQEAMTNIAKHSGATKAWVDLHYADADLELTIRDNGKGFDDNAQATSPNNHYGLLGMKERANRISGKLTVQSAAGTGTTIRLTTPTKNSPAKHHLQDT